MALVISPKLFLFFSYEDFTAGPAAGLEKDQQKHKCLRTT